MAINQFIPTQAPTLAQTPAGAALGAFAQGTQNRFLAPELQALVQQQQQKALQAQQLTNANPNILQSQVNSNNASLISTIMHVLQSPSQYGLSPANANQLRGTLAALTGSVQAPIPGSVPVKPVGLTATSFSNQPGQNPTQSSSLIGDLLSPFKSLFQTSNGQSINQQQSAPKQSAIQQLFATQAASPKTTANSAQPSQATPFMADSSHIRNAMLSPTTSNQQNSPLPSKYGVSATNDPDQRKKDISQAINDLSADPGWSKLTKDQKHKKVKEYLRGSGYG